MLRRRGRGESANGVPVDLRDPDVFFSRVDHLAIGFEFGPMTVTRLGIQGGRVRCSVSRGVLASEAEQTRCTGDETAIGPLAHDAGTKAVRDLFGSRRKVKGLDYNEAVEALAEKGDDTASAAKRAAFATPAIVAASERVIRPYSERR